MAQAQPHPFWRLVNKGERLTQEEECLTIAIINLSNCLFKKLTFEEIYDVLLTRKMDPIFTGEHSVIKQLNRIEENMATGNALSRVQADADKLKTQNATILLSVASAAEAQTNANTRLLQAIDSLRNLIGGGDNTALNAVADELEAVATANQSGIDQLAKMTSDATAVVPEPALTIDPATVSVVRNATQQFTAAGGFGVISFKAASGSVDATGLYTPPTDTTVTSDTVTATSQDGLTSASASVTITEPTA